MSKHVLSAALLAASLISQPLFAERYKVDVAHSKLGFSVSHMGLSEVDGRFSDFAGTIDWKPGASDAKIEFTAQAKSVNTDVKQRDDHLRGADFFDVEKFATLTFKSTSVKHLDKDRYELKGDLTIHGVTKSVSTIAYVTGPKEAMGDQKIGFRTSFTINRIDYKVGDNAKFSSDAAIGHEVRIEIKGEAAQVKAAQQ